MTFHTRTLTLTLTLNRTRTHEPQEDLKAQLLAQSQQRVQRKLEAAREAGGSVPGTPTSGSRPGTPGQTPTKPLSRPGTAGRLERDPEAGRGSMTEVETPPKPKETTAHPNPNADALTRTV